MNQITPVKPAAGSLTLKYGVHTLKHADDYHRDPAGAPSLSSTIARKLLFQSPRHAWFASPRLNPDWEPEDKSTFDIGRVAHRLTLGKGDEYAVIPSDILSSNGATSTKEAKAFIAECRESGVTPIKEADHDAAARMAGAVQSRLRELKMELDPARSELVGITEIDGVACRMMADNIPSNRRYMVDVKTTMNAHPDACIRSIVDYGYDVQAAHYLSIWEKLTGEKRTMRFVFVEKKAPHEVTVLQLHDNPDDEADWMLDAHHKIGEARRIWRECLEADQWPGYPAQIAVVGAPHWHRSKWANATVGEPVIKPKPSAQALRAAHKAQAPGGMAR